MEDLNEDGYRIDMCNNPNVSGSLDRRLGTFILSSASD